MALVLIGLLNVACANRSVRALDETQHTLSAQGMAVYSEQADLMALDTLIEASRHGRSIGIASVEVTSALSDQTAVTAQRPLIFGVEQTLIGQPIPSAVRIPEASPDRSRPDDNHAPYIMSSGLTLSHHFAQGQGWIIVYDPNEHKALTRLVDGMCQIYDERDPLVTALKAYSTWSQQDVPIDPARAASAVADENTSPLARAGIIRGWTDRISALRSHDVHGYQNALVSQKSALVRILLDAKTPKIVRLAILDTIHVNPGNLTPQSDDTLLCYYSVLSLSVSHYKLLQERAGDQLLAAMEQRDPGTGKLYYLPDVYASLEAQERADRTSSGDSYAPAAYVLTNLRLARIEYDTPRSKMPGTVVTLPPIDEITRRRIIAAIP